MDIDGKILFKWILKKWDSGVDRIHLPRDRDRWRTIVNFCHERLGSLKFRECLD
jgi:hypothetical protein